MMNSIKKFLLLSVSLSCLSVSAISQESAISIGLKYGQMKADNVAGLKVKGENAPGFSLGYNLTDNVAVELERLQGGIKLSNNVASAKADIDTWAIYTSYRSSGTGYYLAKIGILNEKGTIIGESVSDVGLSMGLGGGIRMGENFALELEYTILEADIDFLGLTSRFSF